jgi:iron-sulfur cluster assembly protein
MITATPSAIKKITQQIQRRGKGSGIRIGVKTTGCSGLAYVLEFVDSPLDNDLKVECDGCAIYIDPKSSPYVQGMIVDYAKNGLNEGFEFRNPNERDRCGCGESFRI